MALPLLLSGCSPEEILTKPGASLTFSNDTLSFDTLFSNTGSTTAWLRIRNGSGSTLRIASIRLKSGGSSGYLLNLDGVQQTRFDGVEIPPHDSLFLFVRLKASLQGADTPQLLSDAVLFDTDGPQQQIVLQAWSWDAVCLRGTVFRSDTVLSATKPIVVYDSLVVAENATLTLSPGLKLHFHDGAFLQVNGRLLAEGTRQAPIVFRGDRLDKVFTDFPYDYYPGQWGYIRLGSTSYGNRFDCVDIHGSAYGLIADSSDLSRSKADIRHSVIHNTTYSCLWSVSSVITVSNTQLTNSGSYTVALIGGIHTFTHCTLANHQNLVTRDGSPTLVLANGLTDSGDTSLLYPFPLTARFVNCIVSGSQTQEVGFAKYAAPSWSLVFDHTLMRSGRISTEMAQTINCKYRDNVGFLKLGSKAEHYVYDFRLDSLSVARDAGTTDCLTAFPLDKNGVSRLVDGKPDLGAYEWFLGQK
jgi:hypothetical protein